MRRPRTRRGKRAIARTPNGFTLVELLVVVAIISLLVTILMPSLSRAMELARAAVCLSNIRHIGLGFSMYRAENDDYIPAEGHWTADLVLNKYVDASMYSCPSAKKLDKGPGDIPIYVTIPYEDEIGEWWVVQYPGKDSYLLNVRGGVSYGINYRGISAPPREEWRYPYTGFGEPPVKAEDIGRLDGEVVLVAENNTSPYPQNSYAGISGSSCPAVGPSWGVLNERHLEKGSVVFLNGRAAAYQWVDITREMWNIPEAYWPY